MLISEIAHEIRLSHEQCVLITTALMQCQMQGYFGANASEREEIDLLTKMFSELPAEHDANKITYGFSL